MNDFLLKIHFKVEENLEKLKRILFKEKKGAAVLETVLLIVMAVVIIGFLINYFTKGKDGQPGLIEQIFNKITGFLNINP